MDRFTIKFKVFAILVDMMGAKERSIDEEDKIEADLGYDSLDIVELIMDFEKEFNIQIADDEIEDIKTVKQVIDLIEVKLK